MDLVFPEEICPVPLRHFPVLGIPSATAAPPQGNGSCGSTQMTHAPSQAAVDSVRRIIECGNRHPRWNGEYDTTGGANDSARRSASLQSALSIICHVAAMDKSQFFMHRQQNKSKSTSNNSGGGLKQDYFITDIYTTVRALKLEYDEVLRNLRDETSAPGENAEKTELGRRETERRVDDCLRLLESTLTELLLNFAFIGEVPAAHVEEMLQGLSRVFAMEKWPCIILQSPSADSSRQKRQRVSSRPLVDERGCVSTLDERDDVANATTAIVFKALQDLKRNDHMHLLRGEVSASKSKTDGVPQSQLGFSELVANTLGGAYRERGLLAALHDVKRFLYGVYDTASPQHVPVITSLHAQFERDVRHHYSVFLRKAGLSTTVADDVVLQVKTMFDVNPLPVRWKEESNEEWVSPFGDTQKKCLKLLDHLRAVDTKGWFEYPAFDLANIELSSIERWICGAYFGTKTNREAFTALRDVLEQMVDNCVLSYGPNNQYSRVITMVRQRLVDASRDVGLL